jgi:hypothetical protein
MPPTPRHKNPVNNLPITDRSFKDYRKTFWNGKAHSPAKEKLPPGRTKKISPFFTKNTCLNNQNSPKYPSVVGRKNQFK